MISPRATVRIEVLSLTTIQVKEFERRYTERLLHYVDLLQTYPEDYPGLLSVVSSDTHPGMYALLDGHTRFCASLMAGRRNALCVIIEEPPMEEA